ncbi:hypothetical protein ABT160_27780 [Streptomyces sp. NPDC001941]|uniref:HAAS signaling domain-containing protein n=1 Tax=Streptomyces sp. NPDC001941 TaxID=3154659 RepID=UPI00331F6A49
MTTSTLTDRYVHEVVRRIPADQRDDVADELRATIDDTVEAREEADRAGAERAVLTEMGDPIRLAARYADRPLGLIGPDCYPAYVRLLTILLWTVLPIVVAVSVVADLVDGDGIGKAIGGGVVAVLTVGGQMVAWLTLVFALVERNAKGRRAPAWSPDQLPEPRTAVKGERDTGDYASAVWHVLLIGLILWQHFAKPYRAEGGAQLEILDPGLWSGPIWLVLAGLAGITTLEVVRLAGRAWTLRLALWYAAAEALFALSTAWILKGHDLFEERFLSDVNGGWRVPGGFYTVAAVLVLAVSAGEIVKRLREARARG